MRRKEERLILLRNQSTVLEDNDSIKGMQQKVEIGNMQGKKRAEERRRHSSNKIALEDLEQVIQNIKRKETLIDNKKIEITEELK